MANDEKEQARQRARVPWPFQLLGWIAGASGLLHLIRDLKLVEIYGLLKDWMQAYSSFVSFVKNVLLGWINFKWMNISAAEANVLIISAVFIAAYGRAEVRDRHDKGKKYSYLVGLVAPLIYLLYFVLIAALLPDPFGFYGAAASLLLLLYWFFEPDSAERQYAARSAIVSELLGSFCLLVVALIANYALFR